MLHKPRFKHCLHIETVEPEGVFLLSEAGSFLLSGRLPQLVALLIDGDRTVDAIAELLQEQASAAEVYYALMLMEQKGYIVEANDNLPPVVAAFCDTLNVAPIEANRRLQATRVAVNSFGAVAIEPLISTLESLNIQVCQEESERVAEGQPSFNPKSDLLTKAPALIRGRLQTPKLAVVLTDDYLQDGLDAFNQKALQSQQPWMLVKPVGRSIWIGPIFHPGKTGCWECLAQRLRGNRPVETFIQKRKGISTPFPTSSCVLPSTWQTALNITATEILKWIIQGENKQLEGTLVTLDTLSLETQNHILVQRPQCPSCGFPKFAINREPVVLQSRKKTFTTDGGHRCFLPEETLKKYEHHISPITGVVRGLRQISLGENGLTHTYVAGHHFATMFDDLYGLRQNIGGRSGGKGKTDSQARASGFCEAIERYSGVFQGDEIRHKGSYKTMGDRAIHPNACMNFSQAQYNNRAQWNASCPSFFQKVPEPFDEEREIEWTPVWSLTHQEFKYLPTAYCYHGYPKPSKPDCWADSNGCAAGNTIEEAILQGFMELVERDSVALWWYNHAKRPVVNLDSFNEPYFQALKDYYQTINRDFWVLDITSDLTIPTFVAISRRTDREIEDIIFGYGAHFDPKIAILRAVTEINQSLPAVLSVATHGSTQYLSSEQLEIDWWKTANLENQPYLVPDEMAAPKRCADYPQLWSDDLLEDIMTCVAIAKKQGMEVLVLDQTRPDIGLNVVKVIVPGMRHFWKRWGHGRLYDVPVKLDWLKEPRKENQLNPFPIDS